MSKRIRRSKTVKKSTKKGTTNLDPMNTTGWAQAAEQLKRAAAAARSASAFLAGRVRGQSAHESSRASGREAIALAATALSAMQRMILGGRTRQQAEFEQALEKIRANEAWISVLLERV